MKTALRPVRLQVYAVVLVNTAEQWTYIEKQFPNTRPGVFRGRQFLSRNFGTKRVVFLRGGETRVLAAAAAQFGIDRWNPMLIMTTADEGVDAVESVAEVCEINGVRLLSEPVTAANIEDSVPAAITYANREA